MILKVTSVADIGLGSKPIKPYDIELSESKPSTSKSILTSPSLESLNEKAKEAFSDTSSPKSDDSSITITPDESNILANLSSTNWFIILNSLDLEKVRQVENLFVKNGPLTIDDTNLISESLAHLTKRYDLDIKVYESLSEIDKIQMKTYLFNFRSWISLYYNIIIPNTSINTIIGNIDDKPTSIVDKIVEITQSY